MDEILDDDLSRDLSKITLSEEKRINIAKSDVNSYLKDMRQGRNVLIFLLVVTVISYLFLHGQAIDGEDGMAVIIEGIVGAAIFGLCLFGLYHKPRIALSVALVTYIVSHLLVAIMDPSMIIRGILLKIVVIFFLGKATAAAFKLPKSLEQLRNYGLSEDELSATKKLEDLKLISYLR